MSLDQYKIEKNKVGFFNFKQLNDKYLLTNDTGAYCFLNPSGFKDFLSGDISKSFPATYSELVNKGFIRDRLDFDELIQRYAKKNVFLAQGPSLHIVVVTLRCDHKCVYCQSGAQPLTSKNLDMDISTAGNVVDMIFKSPSQYITIEFQGGEPLVNWDTVKFIIEYAKEKNITSKKNLLISLVSNLSFMTEEKLKYLLEQKVSICTSLDGHEYLHNKNRIAVGDEGIRNSYKNTTKWIRIINNEIRKIKHYKFRINALATITRLSLSYSRRIIDEYLNLGLRGIHLRPVAPFCLNKMVWNKVSFSAGEYLSFYRDTLDYIIKVNLKGKKIYERTAKIFLTKILTDGDCNFLDIRSPCGAGIGQLAYNFNGDVYTCDEARMLSIIRDDSFKVGNVRDNSYEQLINNKVVKTMSTASCLDNLAGCSECVYKPYCGVCPIYNYVTADDLFSPSISNQRCIIFNSILDYIFEKFEDKQVKAIFSKWIEDN